MILLLYCFLKLNFLFFITKLSTVLNTLISLNKTNLNYYILILIILSITFLYNAKYLYITLYLCVYLYLFKYINFLTFFHFGFFKIHPFLFYCSLSLYLIIIKNYKFCIKTNFNTCIYISIISLLLGGLWALYQLGWGYYWSNDPIEYALIFIVFIYIKQVHKISQLSQYKFIWIICTLVYVYLIRANLIYTRHNFFTSNSLWFIFGKIIILCFFINTLLLHNIKQQFFFFKIWTCFVIITILFILFFNLTFNKFIKNFSLKLTQIIFYILLITINWDQIKLIKNHIGIIFGVLIFNFFKIRYSIVFENIKIFNLNSKNLDNYYKTNTVYIKNNFKYIRNIAFSYNNKLNNSIKNLWTHRFEFKRFLLNFFI